VRACLAAGLRAAVVTSSKRKLVDLKRRGAPLGLLELFEALFCSDDGALLGAPGKPHPRCYLRAAEELGVPPGDCLVLEDSVAGMEAGVAAGCFVVGVPDPALDAAAVAASGAHVVLQGGLAAFDFAAVEGAAAAWAAAGRPRGPLKQV
jgi:beta-phosphoglucomutase-like phosphatase (HAD superfamily)